MRYTELMPEEFEAVMRDTPVAYLPWGALEWHGYHMPMGVDGMKAEAILQRVADKTGGVVLPAVWCGYDTLAIEKNGAFPFTLEFKRDTIKQLLTDYLEQLSDVGFKLIVVLTSHYGPPHTAALIEAANLFTIWETERDTRVWVIPENELGLHEGYRGDHAAKWETTIMMHLRPDLVKMERLSDETAGAKGGILGEDPRGVASAELGEHIVGVIVDRLAERVQRYLKVGHE